MNRTFQCSALFDDGNLCGESPLWDVARQKLYWTDAAGRKLYSCDLQSKRKNVVLDGFEVNGCALDESGGLILINNAGVWLWKHTNEPSLIADTCGTDRLQLNDCIADPQGRLLTGSCFYNPATEYELGKLFCVHSDGSAQVLDEGFHLANGLGFSSDGRTLYVTDSVVRKIYAYEYDPTTGQVSAKRIFVELGENDGLPDGLTVDAEEFVWSAEWYGSRISRYTPEGQLERWIEIPAKQTSSLAFGGPDLLDIFVTSAAKSEPMPVMPAGYDPDSGYFGGALFQVRAGIKGKAEYKTKFNIAGN